MSHNLLKDVIRECLSYDPETGDLTWIKSLSNRAPVGTVAGNINSKGYRFVRINGKSLPATRVIWFLQTGQWPINEIDHWDRNPGNNRWPNLRLADREGNTRNTRGYSSSDFKGVYPQNSKTNPWQAQIQVGSKTHCLGSYQTKEEAAKAYDTAARDHFGEFAYLNFPLEEVDA